MDDTPVTEEDARKSGATPTQVYRRLLLDISVTVSRLVAKAVAKNSMSIRCKFEGGKVVNRSLSGSWEFRCMGAGLRKV